MTEIGHNGTENIHLHGIVWTQHDIRNLAEIWQYGYIWDGQKKNENRVNYISERTIDYITKYITKTDEKHKTYKPIILTSAGIGRGYTETANAQRNKYKTGETKETYRARNGTELALPIYYLIS